MRGISWLRPAPSPSAVDAITLLRHRGRDGQEPRPLRDRCTYHRDSVDTDQVTTFDANPE